MLKSPAATVPAAWQTSRQVARAIAARRWNLMSPSSLGDVAVVGLFQRRRNGSTYLWANFALTGKALHFNRLAAHLNRVFWKLHGLTGCGPRISIRPVRSP